MEVIFILISLIKKKNVINPGMLDHQCIIIDTVLSGPNSTEARSVTLFPE